jgi:hypothetical protein
MGGFSWVAGQFRAYRTGKVSVRRPHDCAYSADIGGDVGGRRSLRLRIALGPCAPAAVNMEVVAPVVASIVLRCLLICTAILVESGGFWLDNDNGQEPRTGRRP